MSKSSSYPCILPRDGNLDTDIKTPLYHFRDVIGAKGLKVSEDATAWDTSYRFAEALLAITIVTILFLTNFVLIHKSLLSAKFKLLIFSRKVLQRKMKMAIHVDNRPIITLILRNVGIKKPT